jgi:hypothetical protein
MSNTPIDLKVKSILSQSDHTPKRSLSTSPLKVSHSDKGGSTSRRKSHSSPRKHIPPPHPITNDGIGFFQKKTQSTPNSDHPIGDTVTPTPKLEHTNCLVIVEWMGYRIPIEIWEVNYNRRFIDFSLCCAWCASYLEDKEPIRCACFKYQYCHDKCWRLFRLYHKC